MQAFHCPTTRNEAWRRLRCGGLGVLFFLATTLLQAQQFTPHIGYVYPAGGKQGSSFQVRIGGQYLDGVTNAFVSGPGIQVRVVEHTKPLTQKQFTDLRDRLRALQAKRQAAFRPNARRKQEASGSGAPIFTVQDQQEMAQIMKQIAGFVRRPPNPAIAEVVTLQVTMSPDAELATRELRLDTPRGLSNPLVFCVGEIPEFSKKIAQPSDQAGPFRPFRQGAEQRAVPPSEMTVNLPATVNGQILPGGVDRIRFQARQGQNIVATLSARDLIPYLADAVPGWFQATLTLYDSKGRELGYDDDYKFHPDPVLHFQAPRDGEYTLEVKDSIFRGREDFVYRLSIGELPFITSIFPLGGQLGKETSVKLQGWNLPADTVVMDGRRAQPGETTVQVRQGDRVSNPVPFAFDALPDLLEKEPNDSPPAAQRVSLPVIVNGCIDHPGDEDIFRFEGHSGDKVVGEVYARRLDSPLDSLLQLTDSTGRQLAINDDCSDPSCGLNTHHADSRLEVTLPTDGTYYFHLTDAQKHGGPDYAYRLRISPPQPEFALRVVPSSLNTRAGVNVPITVYALRKDGFTNEIALELKDAPAGFRLSGARIPPGEDRVRLTLMPPFNPPSAPVTLAMEGRASIQGKSVVHPAVPAEDMMQAFAYHHLVPAQEWKLAVFGRGMGRGAVRILGDSPVKIPIGGTARIRLATPANAFADRFQLELNDPPEGLAIEEISPSAEGTEIVLKSDGKMKAGLKGNLIFDVLPGKAMVAQNQKGKKQANQRRTTLGALPAVPFEIVGN